MGNRLDKGFKTQLRIYLTVIFLPILSISVIMYIFIHTMFFVIAGLVLLVFYAVCFFKLIPDFWNSCTYSEEYKSLKFNRGIFLKCSVYISSDSVEYISVTKGIIQRALGLCTVNFVMGGGVERLWGVDEKTAEELRIKLER